MICVHLWCLWNYYADRRLMNATVDGTIECPCHGSKYDPNNGLAVAGPAAMQTEPNNALPRLDIEIEDNGDLVVIPPTWTVSRNGVIGFGRYV
jgi:ubiquinol-cytochrome c reductase iron-sulfur subunit